MLCLRIEQTGDTYRGLVFEGGVDVQSAAIGEYVVIWSGRTFDEAFDLMSDFQKANGFSDGTSRIDLVELMMGKNRDTVYALKE